MNSSEGLRGFITFLILLAILTTGVVGFNYISTPTSTTSQADEPKLDPLNLSVSNVTETSANITWTTVDATASNLIYSKILSAPCLLDIEASADNCLYTEPSDPQTSHTVQLNELDPDTTYFFRVSANGRIYPKDSNHTFRTSSQIETPASTNTPENTSGDYDGFGEINIAEPKINFNSNEVLGVMDENIMEPIDPLGDMDNILMTEFKDALLYNDLRKDFNKDGEVTMADYPLFIEFVTNYED